ncbi:hypothetical protein K469DRAFT_715878 [Zopfia rhizophila CBS 207.26]|uniref:Uncharacterized protein n=1 Tax=Zopfia rhizophila CBS 207.26 TaxID=1314779 RepID=A0A6A6DQ58_9PEZI|nr:hypothetical protein K469DRAFT_715878 [Zopfia rhizophila CBS 207.26]
MSPGSVFSIPTFPSPCYGIGSIHSIISPPPTFELSRPPNEHAPEPRTPDSPTAPSSPFEVLVPVFSSSPERPLLADEYDPTQPHLVYHTLASNRTNQFPSPFSTIPEESSAASARTVDHERLCSEGSPQCLRKAIRPHSFLPRSVERLPCDSSVETHSIREEPVPDNINPARLSKDAFSTFNHAFDNPNTGTLKTSESSSRNGIPMPISPTSAKPIFKPLIGAAFPSSPPFQKEADGSPSSTPKRARSTKQSNLAPPRNPAQPGSPPSLPRTAESSPSSVYSVIPSSPPSHSPLPPCSPRPKHAELPAPSLNFTNIPTLFPPPSGPRRSPPRPLWSSIQTLRRMNSDANKCGREERRYLRLGREDSIALPGEESWLDKLENAVEDDETWGEEKGALVGGAPDDWEEEAKILEEVETKREEKAGSSTTGKDTENAKDGKAEQPVQHSSSKILFSSPKDDRSSSIWEDGEKFWHSTPSHPPLSPRKTEKAHTELPSSLPAFEATVSTPKTSCKRDFGAAKDDSPSPKQEKSNDKQLAGNRYRKRSALGTGTPNVRTQVQPPGGSLHGTPGSLYDQDGFLRV